MENGGWIAVDLDGTLAEYHGWDGGKIGKPIPRMLNRVKKWLSEGLTVKIFTARAKDLAAVPPIRAWLVEQGLPALEVTNEKDYCMVELWDDRAVAVEMNTGAILGGRSNFLYESN